MARFQLDNSGEPKLLARIETGNGLVREVEALIDTGASGCFVPPQLARDLAATVQHLRGVNTGHGYTMEPAYYLRIEIPTVLAKTWVFAEMPNLFGRILLGRDLLKEARLVFTYDASSRHFDLTAPRDA